MEFVEIDGFTIIGIAARTSFPRENMPGGAIPALWDRVSAGGVLDAIPNKADREIVAVYTDYESDEFGEYTLVIGARTTSVEVVPAGMVMKSVPASRYAVFTSERGSMASVVIGTWKRIWAEPRTAEYTRSYRADFEVYGAAANPANGVMQIFVGVK